MVVSGSENIKPIVFTFDDGLVSHLERVCPLFKEYNFNATFFISKKRDMWVRRGGKLSEKGMTDEQILEVHKMGFEIGNHTLNHCGVRHLIEINTSEIKGLESYLQDLDIPKPSTFCYPGFYHHVEAAKLLKRLGYKFARTGYNLGTDRSWHTKPHLRTKIHYYEPSKTDSMTVFSTMILNDNYGLKQFQKDLDNTPEGTIPVVTAHGLKLNSRWAALQDVVKHTKDSGFQGIAFRDMPYE